MTTRRELLASIAGAGSAVVAGCGTLEYRSTFVQISRGTTVEPAGGGWLVDGAVEVQFGHEFDPESLEDVSVEALGDDGRLLGKVVVGTVVDASPDDPTTVDRSFELSATDYPHVVTVRVPESERERFCGNGGEIRAYALRTDASPGEPGRLDEGPWERRTDVCRGD